MSLIVVGGLVMAAYPPVETRFAAYVADRLAERISRPTFERAGRLDGIIVLGGSVERVKAALDLAETFPEARLVLSGPGELEVATARERLEAARLVVDHRPRNTFENGLFSKNIVGSKTGPDAACWVVVTSAVHMPRALGVFQAIGLDVVPWPIGDTPQVPRERSASVWHEVFGLIGYWALGRNRELFPRCVDGDCGRGWQACRS